MSKKEKKKEYGFDDLKDVESAQQNMMLTFLGKNKKVVSFVLILVLMYVLNWALTLYTFFKL